MAFLQADVPDIDPEKFESIPVMERMKLLAHHWVDYGFGAPKIMHSLYLVKGLFFFIGGWLIIGLSTPGLPLTDLGAWWGELIVYQKAMLWVVLWSATGFNESWGPLAFKFKPNTAGYRYWMRTGTLRLPPWPDKVPFTRGDERRAVDVALYFSMLASLALGLVLPGQQTAAAYSEAGLVPAWPFITYVALQLILGLRDRVTFLASRPEQYSVILLGFGLLTLYGGGSVDMIIVAKIAMFAVWWGAFLSKIGVHFTPTVQTMLTNGPLVKSKALRRSLYRDAPNDLMPTRLAWFAAHVMGTIVEFVVPLILLFTTNWTVAVLAAAFMMCFHVFIYSMFALAMPQEWNLFYVFATPVVFLGFFNGDGYALWDASSVWVVVAAAVLTLTGPLVGNFRPDKISFLISMRQYAGNWANSTMAFRNNGCEAKLDNPEFVTSMPSPKHQLSSLFGEAGAEMFLQKTTAFRMMNTQGRGHMSIFPDHVDSMENYRFREGEVMCTFFSGWQFGDGHLFDERTIAAVQKRCNFAPGEFISVWTESQPLHKKTIEYRVIDAALGVVERGHYDVRDVVKQQPWLPDGPIPYTVTWRHPEYLPADKRASTAVPSSPGAEGDLSAPSPVTGHDESTVEMS
ncbi:DUF3556 domain-containing protein [Dietzia cinnamea]|uniref:DUF3556 domain-containing protein n=1 Tax=Dietzia cinnamea TaxID=321318 RepID=A0ABV3YEY1_9ACTN|nr:DUF3556 domain-containing protein [Dietzia cinnamea]MCT1885193.1 DUF3556 domain-containing protein [Dietzia cinnamea]